MFRLIIAGYYAGQVCSATPERNTDAFADIAELRFYGSGWMLLRFPQAEEYPDSPALPGTILGASTVRAFPGGGT